ncbi:MAG: Fe-S cluster assembly protein IscX [Acidimicrobiia bacterium]
MTLGWQDLDALVDALRDANPRVDPRALDDNQLRELAERLEGFDPGGTTPGPGDFEAMRAMWHWGV